tara:strand:- start:128 stop:553 length:426 start_codon:yes stop_codon:yes gene_type:complete
VITVKTYDALLSSRLQHSKELLGGALKDKLEEIAHDAVHTTLTSVGVHTKNNNIGAVDTGAYLMSFSFSAGAGRPRGKSSRNKGKHNNPAGEAMANLYNDINKIDLLSSTRITLRNNSPHARYVEFKHGFYIFTKLRNKHG